VAEKVSAQEKANKKKFQEEFANKKGSVEVNRVLQSLKGKKNAEDIFKKL